MKRCSSAANWYDLRGPLGTVAVITEERKGWLDDLIRNLFDRHSRKLFVLNNAMTEVLLELSRKWFILTSSMEVTSPTLGQQLGRVERSLNPVIRTYVLRDASGKIFATLRSPIWRYWHFSIRGPSGGEPLGVIRKKWGGLQREYFTRADRFLIDFGDHDWTLEQRWLLVAAVVAIDLDSFETRGAGPVTVPDL